MRRVIVLLAVLAFPGVAATLLDAASVHIAFEEALFGPRPEPDAAEPQAAILLIPPPDWREHAYLAANPDVAAAVRSGAFRSGYDHYHRFGALEGRTVTSRQPQPAAKQPGPLQPPEPSLEPFRAPEPPPPLAAAAPPEPSPPPEAAPEPAPPAPERPVADAGIGPDPVAAAAALATVERVRFGRHDGFVRVVLDLDRSSALVPALSADGRTLTVDLGGAGWKAAERWTGSRDFPLAAYEVHGGGTAQARLVFRARRPIRVLRIASLPPGEGRGHRTLLDLAETPP